MKVLAIGCHPDDLEIACGGTLRKYVEEGADVYMCHVANGNMGHVEILPEPLREIRTIESEAAGKIIGAKKVFNLDVGDVTVTRFDNDVVDAMADVVHFLKKNKRLCRNFYFITCQLVILQLHLTAVLYHHWHINLLISQLMMSLFQSILWIRWAASISFRRIT